MKQEILALRDAGKNAQADALKAIFQIVFKSDLSQIGIGIDEALLDRLVKEYETTYDKGFFEKYF